MRRQAQLPNQELQPHEDSSSWWLRASSGWRPHHNKAEGQADAKYGVLPKIEQHSIWCGQQEPQIN